ncbi:LIM domain-containing protein [Nocardiopsis nanhaiensis]
MDMSDKLLASAQRWAASSLDSYMQTPPDNDFSVHHMGVAVEHVSKAYLCSVSVVLLTPDKPSIDDLLVLGGHEDKARKSISEIRTVMGEAAINRTAVLLKNKRVSSEQVQKLREARNGITHLGVWNQDSRPKELLAAGITYINEILTALSRSELWFWKRHTELIRKLLVEAESELELRYQEKLQRARENFWSKVGSLSESQKDSVIASLEQLPVSSRWHMSIPTRCPACESLGIATGREHLAEFGAWFGPRHFACRVCDLELEGFELQLANIDAHAIDDIDGDPDWEPDFDSM